MADIFIYDGNISSSDAINVNISSSNAMYISHSAGQDGNDKYTGPRIGIGDSAQTHHLEIGGLVNNSAIGFGSTYLKLGTSDNIGYNRIYGNGTNMTYSVGTGYHRWLNQTTELMRLLSDGKLGIGTTNPSRALVVSQSATSAGTSMSIANSYGESGKALYFDHHDGSNLIPAAKIIGFGRNLTSALPYLSFEVNNTTAAGASSLTEERMRILADGNVGIGTSTPGEKLTVHGTVSASVDSSGSFGAGLFVDKVAIARNDIGTTSDLIIGEGVANVNVTLFGDEDSTTQASLWFADNAAAASPHYGGIGFVYDGNDNHLTIRRGGSTNNLFTIDADNGKTAIGLSSGNPAAKLQVYGDIIVGDGSTNIISSPQYFSGFAGSGFRIGSGSFGTSAEFDKLTVRGTFNVYELVANQIRATHGALWISNAGKIISASQIGGYIAGGVSYSMYFETGSDTIDHGFARGDLIRAQKFDGTNVFQSNMTVTSRSDSGSIIAVLEVSSTPPTASYDYVRIGNTIDTDRDASIYLTADDNNAPYIDILDGVDSHAAFNQSGKIKVRLGNLSGITDADVGGALSGYGLYSENVYLKGLIKAEAGEIGGFGINAASISSSNDNLILRSTGQITASDFLFLGSGTITGSVEIGASVTIGGQLSVGSLPALPKDENLIAHWNFNQGTGSIIRDHVGNVDSNGNRWDIDPVNDPNTLVLATYSSESISGYGWKRPSATSSQNAINVSSSISSSFGSESGSISFWLNTDYSTNGDDQWILFGENGENVGYNKEDFFYIDQQAGGQFRLLAYSGSGGTGGYGTGNEWVSTQDSGTSIAVISDFGPNYGSGGGRRLSASLAAANSGSKGWVHWVINWGSGSDAQHMYRIYINGELSTYRVMTGSDTLINFRPYNLRPSWVRQKQDDATIDEIRLYNSTLTPREVRGLFLSPAGINTGTTITGDQIKTGQLQSNNWNNDNAGSMIDLVGGTIHMGGLESNARLYFDGTNLTVSGSISASEGNIGGWKIEPDKLVDGADTIRLEPNGTYVISTSDFQIDAQGAFSASAGLISGSVTASKALIGGWTINESAITSDGDHVKLNSSAKRITINSQTFSEKGIQLEYNSGAPRAYIGDGDKAGSFIQYDETDGVRLGPKVTLAFGSTMLPGDNLLNDFSNLLITDPWVQSATPNYVGTGFHGSEATDSEISMSLGPHGLHEKVWVASPDSDGSGGGWYSDWFPIDSGSTYQFASYVKFLRHATGSFYFGTMARDSQSVANSDSDWPAHFSLGNPNGYSGSVHHHQWDTATGNPYFYNIQDKGNFTASIADGGLGGQLDRWFLVVAYVHATGSVYAGHVGGIYDTVTGRKLQSFNDFRWHSGSEYAMARSFHYAGFQAFADDDTPSVVWAKPSVRKVTQATTDISSFIDIGTAIATGQYSGSSTFITSTSIYSPNIAGQDGYISNKLTVGTAGEGVTLDGTNKKLYVGTGDWKNSNTSFVAGENVESSTELVTNGDMELNADWGEHGAVTGVAQTSDESSSGTHSFKYTIQANHGGLIQEDVPLVGGKTYKVSWDIFVPIGSADHYNVLIFTNTTNTVTGNVYMSGNTHGMGFDYAVDGEWKTSTVYVKANIGATEGDMRFSVGAAYTAPTTYYIDNVSVKQVGVFSLGDKFAWDGETLYMTGSLSLIAGDPLSGSVAQLEIDSGSFVSTISSSQEGLLTSINQNVNSITLLVTSASANSSSISQLEINTGSISLEVSQLQAASSSFTGSIASLNLSTASINLAVQTVQGLVTQSQFINQDWSQGYAGWNWQGTGGTGNYAGLDSIGSNLDSWFTGSMDTHLAGIAYTSGSLAVTIGSELITNGGFTNDSTSWTLGPGWVWNTAGTIVGTTVAGNQKINQYLTDTPGASGGTPTNKFIDGKEYEIKVSISNYNAGNINITLYNEDGKGFGIGAFSGNGDYTFRRTVGASSTSTTSYWSRLWLQAGTTFTGDIDNISIKLVEGKMFEIVSGSNLSGSRFGRALEVRSNVDGNKTYIFGSEAIPIDTNRVYQGRVRARMAHVGDNGETNSNLYAGFVCLDEFGNQITENPMTHRWFLVNNRDLIDSDPYDWKEYSGSISRTTTEAGGAGSEDLALISNWIGNNGVNSGNATTHNVFKTGTKYIRPVIIANSTLKDTAMQIDGFTLQDVTDTVVASSSLVITATSIISTVETQAGLISSIEQETASIALNVASASNAASLMINPQGVVISGSSLEFSGSSFYFGIGGAAEVGASGAFISGSSGNIEISSSNFHLMASGSAIFSGSISASQGDIGGWSLQTGKISSNNITLSSSNDEIVVGANKEIILSGSGAGQVAGGGITWDKYGNLKISNAELVVSGGSYLQDDIYDSANSKWVIMDDDHKYYYATYEPNTQITITRVPSGSEDSIISSSVIPEQYFCGEFAAADLKPGDIIDADKPIQVVGTEGGNSVLPYTMMSTRFYGRTARGGYTRGFTFFTPAGSGSLTASFGVANDGVFDEAVMFKSISGSNFTIMSGSGENSDAVVWKIESTEPILVYTSGSAATDHTGWMPPSKRIAFMEDTAPFEVLAVAGQTFDETRATGTGGNAGRLVRSSHPFQNEVAADGNGNDQMSGLPVEAFGDTYIIPHETENYQIIAVEPTIIRVYKLQGNGSLEFYAEYDFSSATEDNPGGIEVGSTNSDGGDEIHNSGMLLTATGPFGLRTNTPSHDEYTPLGYRKSQVSTYQGSTTISGDKVRTGKVQSNNWNSNDVGSLFDLDAGTMHLGGSGSNANFYVNKAGDLFVTGSVNATDGNFTGNITVTGGGATGSISDFPSAENLLLHLKFQQGLSGSLVDTGTGGILDSSPYGLSNISAFSTPKWTIGPNGGGMHFGGSDDLRIISSSTGLSRRFNDPINDDALSIAFWVKFDPTLSSDGSGYSMLTRGEFNTGDSSYWIRRQSTVNYMEVKLYFVDALGEAADSPATGLYTSGEFQEGTFDIARGWSHFAFTWRSSDGEMKLYQDGELIKTGTHGTGKYLKTNSTLGNTYIAETDSGGYDLQGDMTDIRIYGEALTPDNIRSLYNNPSGAPGFTRISGDSISTGKILSNNHSGTSDGSGMATEGMAIDLTGGAISAKNFRIASDGSATFNGAITITSFSDPTDASGIGANATTAANATAAAVTAASNTATTNATTAANATSAVATTASTNATNATNLTSTVSTNATTAANATSAVATTASNLTSTVATNATTAANATSAVATTVSNNATSNASARTAIVNTATANATTAANAAAAAEADAITAAAADATSKANTAQSNAESNSDSAGSAAAAQSAAIAAAAITAAAEAAAAEIAAIAAAAITAAAEAAAAELAAINAAALFATSEANAAAAVATALKLDTLSRPAPSGTGLFLSATNLGFYDSSNWKTYMDETGNFYLGGNAEGNLMWNAASNTLAIRGDITVTNANQFREIHANPNLNLDAFPEGRRYTYDTSYNYDDLDSTGGGWDDGGYTIHTAYSVAGEDYGAGPNTYIQTDFSAAKALQLNHKDKNGSDKSTYYDSLVAGDSITYYVTSTRWYTYKIITVDTNNANNRHNFELQFIDENITGGETSISTNPGTDVYFQFRKASNGSIFKPYGIYASYDNSDPLDIWSTTLASGETVLELSDSSDDTTGCVWPAFAVDPNTTYSIEVTLKGDPAHNDGLYLRMQERDSLLPAGYVACSYGSTPGETGKVASFTRQISNLAWTKNEGETAVCESGPVTTDWVTYKASYTPTSTCKVANLSMLNWSGFDVGQKLYVKYASIRNNKLDTTSISGDTITTGKIKSTNWTGTSGVKGTLLDLDNGKLIMRSGTQDYLNFDSEAGSATIAGWTFNDTSFYSNQAIPTLGIRIDKTKGIRGRSQNIAFTISGSQGDTYDFTVTSPTNTTVPGANCNKGECTP